MKVVIQEVSDEDGSRRALFFDGELFDWGMEPVSLAKAKAYSLRDQSSKKAVHGDIQKNFMDALAEFLGRPVTFGQLNEAIRKGEL